MDFKTFIASQTVEESVTSEKIKEKVNPKIGIAFDELVDAEKKLIKLLKKSDKDYAEKIDDIFDELALAYNDYLNTRD